MTLILSWLSHGLVFQVSDRLVSRVSGDQFDTQANKTVVYGATDGFVAISYTGAAFVGDRPTDQWIAETLMRERYADDGVRWNVSPMRLSPWLDSGQAAHALLTAANEAVSESADSHHYLEMCMAGWQQWKSAGHYRPYYWSISNENRSFQLVRHSCRKPVPVPLTLRSMKRTGAFPTILVATPGANFPGSSAASAERLIRAADGRPDSIEDALLSALRAAADERPGIGADAMSVLVLPRRTRIRYRPLRLQHKDLPYKAGTITRTVVYSPWIIGPRLAVAPAVTTAGGQQVSHLGGGMVTTTELAGESLDRGGLIFSQTGQMRPRRPR